MANGGRQTGVPFGPYRKRDIPRNGTRLRNVFDMLRSGQEIDVSFIQRTQHRRYVRRYLQDRYGLDIQIVRPKTWRLVA